MEGPWGTGSKQAAKVIVTAGGKKQVLVNQWATSYLSNNDPHLHIGLGKEKRNKYSPSDTASIGEHYIGALYLEIRKWLENRAQAGPIGVTFSAGVDSGAVFLLTYHTLREPGESPSRLKAFTISVDGNGEDLVQARKFMEALNLELFLEPVEPDYSALDWKKAIRLVEKESTVSGQVEDRAAIFLTNRECSFHCLMCDLWKNTTASGKTSEAI
jgi:asparagine synthetase B (glutamine-hydrolysing)